MKEQGIVEISNDQKIIFYQLRNSKNNSINYCYLIINETNRTALLIDPAWEPEKFELIFESYQIKLVNILLTHHHYDHIDLANYFALKFDSQVYMSEKEINYYQYQCKNLIPITSEIPFVIGAIKIFPIFTPGHTFGSTCYRIQNRLFTGDTLFIEGCGLCSGKGGDPGAMFDSLAHLRKFITDDTQIYPGHRYYAELGQHFSYVLESNIYLHFTEKEEFIKFRMRKGQKELFNFK